MQSNPVEITKKGLSAIFSESDLGLVKTLATRLNMGGVIAEEVCSHSGIDKNTGCQDLSDEMVETVHRGIAHVFGKMDNLKPHITYKDENKIDVIPFEIFRYTDLTKRYFNTFSEALDEFFGAVVKEQAIEKKPERKQNPLEHRLTQQENAIRKFERDKSDMSAKAEAVYTNYQPVDELLGLVRQELADGRTRDEIRAEHSEIKRTDPRNRTITIELDGMDLPLDTGKNVPQNAQIFYDRSKKIGSKLNGAVRAIENTRELLKARVKKPKAKMPVPKRPKPRWYDQYRWFRTSDGLLVIGGRGATSNEEIVKKYLEKRDIFMHSQAPGAPVTIIKVDKGTIVSEQTIAEAAQFAISYSSIWKSGQYTGDCYWVHPDQVSGQYTGDCYWVHPDQVSKTPEHGEFVSKGAFIIRGTRNYLKDVSVGIAIGITSDLHLIGGPVSAVSNQAENVIEIVPGRFNQNDIAKKIYRIFSDTLGRSIKVVASPDQIAKFLPPGESDIKSKGK
jgi:predicted ribosome quality control (RQC) complex YloA/Tae2 family protein